MASKALLNESSRGSSLRLQLNLSQDLRPRQLASSCFRAENQGFPVIEKANNPII
jgi:hypothetical protein